MAADRIRFSTSVVMVKDVGASRRFYESVMGQNVMLDHGPNVVFAGGFSIWEAEHANRIIFGGTGGDGVRTGCDNLELYFEVEDVEGAFHLLEEAGASIVHPVHEEPWGQRTFRCHDPDGHIVEVGEPMEAAIRRLFAGSHTPEEIVSRTSMPMEVVLQAIGYPRFC